ncbi:MAG: glycosyltransferase family 4 protein [Bacillota bacterium]
MNKGASRDMKKKLSRKKFTILSVAYPFAPVRQDTAGGAEHVLAMLDSALVKHGHTSIVIASKDSTPEGILIETPGPDGKIDGRVESYVHKKHRAAISEAIKKWDIDLIHMHGIDFENYLPPEGIPVLVTLHLPPEWYSESINKITRPKTFFNCVSKSQKESCPKLKGMMPFIENGVDISDYEEVSLDNNNLEKKIPEENSPKGNSPKKNNPEKNNPEEYKEGTGAEGYLKSNYALCLGRVCVEKGYHCALDAAKKAGISLVIAGELFPYEYHQEFYRIEIAPRLDGRDYKFIGPVGTERKRKLLKEARCVLIPSLVPETSSLVAMEAMASGTPVIAYPQGALKEIVEDGKTGFLVNSIDEMADAIKKISEIDPIVCRQTARERYSSEKMIERYFALYGSIISKSRSERKHRQAANG